MQSSIVEPLLMFCTHVIRMRDTRCCGIMLRVFRSIVPDFAVTEPATATGGDSTTASTNANVGSIPAATASVIREYISSDVVKACITSIHEPYFVELQKELASLIATVVVSYAHLTATPRDVLLSLPNINPTEVDAKIEFMRRKETSTRQQRATVLDLLRDLKGVSISEMGKLSKSIGGLPSSSSSSSTKLPTSAGGAGKRQARSKMAQQFMTAPPPSNNITPGAGGGGAMNDDTNGTDNNLDGLANLFQ